VISLEFSSTKLAKAVTRPKFVREIDWIEHLWPQNLRADGDYPAVERVLPLSFLLFFSFLRIPFLSMLNLHVLGPFSPLNPFFVWNLPLWRYLSSFFPFSAPERLLKFTFYS
jgi:hypothetical protein